MGQVMTVTGPVDARRLGVTLPHEHVCLDLTCLWQAPVDPRRMWLIDAPVTAAMQAVLKQDPYHSRDNLRLNDRDTARAELRDFARAGGGSVVELSSAGIGPFPRELRVLAQETGLHIVAGTGFYVHRAHPAWVHEAPWEQLSEHMLRQLTEGFGTTGIRAGVLGELGTGSPVHPDEAKVLRAAAAVQRRYPVAINVHLAIFAREGRRVLDLLESYGADLSRVALSHLDEHLDVPYHEALLRRGVFVEFDTFGSECRFEESGTREPRDAERMKALAHLVDRGYRSQLLLSQDVCTKMHWHRYGGRGYDHLLTGVAPALRRAGFSDSDLEVLMVANPARLLGG